MMEFGDKALDESYKRVLAGFDVKGFKRITALKRHSKAHALAVDMFLKTLQAEISKLVTSGRTVFRYKSNGDERLFAVYAKDQAEAEDLLVSLASQWELEAHSLLMRVKAEFREALGADYDDEALAVMGYVDLHVMMCVMTNVYINKEDGSSRPDFVSNSFTMLTPAFKDSHHDEVAMYRDEAKMVLERSDLAAEWIEMEEGSSIGVMRMVEDGDIAVEAA